MQPVPQMSLAFVQMDFRSNEAGWTRMERISNTRVDLRAVRSPSVHAADSGNRSCVERYEG
jgi:hypothetical protein